MKAAVHLALALWLALYAGGAANAQTPAASTIVVEHPWARATPKGAKTGAAYMILMNKGASADRLIGATTPLAGEVQFHKETEANGVSHMSAMQSMEIEPGAKVVFKPGDMHMMLMGLKQPLTQGQAFTLTLQFEKAGSVNVTVPIESVGAMQRGDMNSMMQGAGSTRR